MTAPEIKGWCPTARRPMMSGDGWIVRVTPPMARLRFDQIRELCDLSDRFGNGMIDLTQRGNLQLRGIAEGDLQKVWAQLETHDLISRDPSVDAKAALHMQPCWTQGDLSHDLYRALEAARPNWPDLPSKISVVIDAGDTPLLTETSADFRFEHSHAGPILRADGVPTGALITPKTAPGMLLEMMHWFIQTGGWEAKRMANLVKTVPPPAIFQGIAPLAARSAPTPENQWVGVPFGQLATDDLRLLDHCNLRVTPWRMLFLESGDFPPDHPFITAPNDPRMTIDACPGAPCCLQANGPTRPLAAKITQSYVHVSGCAKGCAHRAASPVTIVATKDGFDLVRNGTAWDKPVLRGLSEAEVTDELAP